MSYDDFENDIHDELGDNDLSYEKEQIRRNMRAAQQVQTEEAAKAQQQFLDQAFREALQQEGLTPEQYQALINSDPETASEVLKSHIKSNVKSTVDKLRNRDSKGRFTKGYQGPTQQQMTPNQQPQQRQRKNPEDYDKLRNNDRLDAIVNDVLGDFFVDGLKSDGFIR